MCMHVFICAHACAHTHTHIKAISLEQDGKIVVVLVKDANSLSVWNMHLPLALKVSLKSCGRVITDTKK